MYRSTDTADDPMSRRVSWTTSRSKRLSLPLLLFPMRRISGLKEPTCSSGRDICARFQKIQRCQWKAVFGLIEQVPCHIRNIMTVKMKCFRDPRRRPPKNVLHTRSQIQSQSRGNTQRRSINTNRFPFSPITDADLARRDHPRRAASTP